MQEDLAERVSLYSVAVPVTACRRICFTLSYSVLSSSSAAWRAGVHACIGSPVAS